MAEAGFKDYETYSWNALFAPANTPPDVIARLNAAANAAIKDPAVQNRLRELSAVTVGSTPEQLAEHVKRELAIWEPVIKAAQISID
jgi:tripartite-type tricarboxylate transporter receptor subunit TctC